MTPSFQGLVDALRSVPEFSSDTEVRVYPGKRPDNKRSNKQPFCIYTPITGVVIAAAEGSTNFPIVQLDVYATTWDTCSRLLNLALQVIERRSLLASAPDAPRMNFFSDLEDGLFRLSVDLELRA